MKIRTDVPDSAFPRRGRSLRLRSDVTTQLPSRRGRDLRRRTDIPDHLVPGSAVWAVGTEWLGRLAGLIAVVLIVLVANTIHKGLVVQQSAKDIVGNFHVTNDFFAQRADLTAPATARKQLQTLQRVLKRLNAATAHDVAALSAILPDVGELMAAGQGDVTVARALDKIAATLRDSAGQLSNTAQEANTTVSDVSGLLSQALALIDALNAELARTERKLAPLPATGGNK